MSSTPPPRPSENHLDLLSSYNQFTFAPDSRFLKQPETTEEIRLLCEDLKVIGKKDFRALIKWRLAMRAMVEQEAKALEEANRGENADDALAASEEELDSAAEEDRDQDELEQAVSAERSEKAAKDKRERRRRQKERRKVRG